MPWGEPSVFNFCYSGANSGPTTYRIHMFYRSREDVRTALRVHPFNSWMGFFDYSAAATGMVCRNHFNPAGSRSTDCPTRPRDPRPDPLGDGVGVSGQVTAALAAGAGGVCG